MKASPGVISPPYAKTAPAEPKAPAFVPGPGRAVLAIVRRDAAERRFLGMPFVLDFLFGIVNLAVFLFISRVLRHPAQPRLGRSGSYFDFVAVGLAFMLVVQAAGTQITVRIDEERRSGTLEILATQPIGTVAVALGLSTYPMVFAVVRAGAYLGVATALLGLDVGSANWLGVAVVLLLGGAVTMCFGIALAAFAVAFEHGNTLGRLLILALAFGSGTYFPVTALPAALRWVSMLLPTRIALDGLRAALTGGGWTGSALLLVGAVLVCLPLAVWLFGQALKLATRRGTLTRS